jgi:AraC-like DNA-binding protein
LPPVDAAAVFGEAGASATYGQGADVILLGGSVAFADARAAELLELLPPALVLRAGADGATPIAWLLDQLDQEWRDERPGGQVVCDDLLRLMFVHALRAHLANSEDDKLGWLAGLNDHAVATALRAIHANPARTWRLSELAAKAGLSRASFAERFKAKVGRPPIEYASRWRMLVAARRLMNGRRSVSAIAEELGFLSDAAFGVAFRRVHGVSPRRYRAARTDPSCRA